PCPGPPPVAPRINALEPVDFGALTGWKEGEQAAAWPAFLASCQALRWREAWRGVCARAMELRSPGDEEARRFLEENFTPWRLAYADQNGHPFQSIGRYLVERGELQLSEASMPAIKAWAAANPKRLEELLNQNPSFVFFRELPLADPASGPVGALGVPLAPGR